MAAHSHPSPLLDDPVFFAASSEACETAGGILCECHRAAAAQLDDLAVAEQRWPPERAAGGLRASGKGGEDHSRGGERGGGGDSSCVLYKEDGGIATLTLNRPKTKHSVNRAVFSRLAELLHRAERSESVLAVVLTGAGGYFTSGADIKELQNDGVPNVPMVDQPFGVFSKAVLHFPKLLAAAVNGPAVGVGVTLLPHCDAVYAYGGKEEEAVPPPPPTPTPSAEKPSNAPAPRGVGERQRRLRGSAVAEEGEGVSGGGGQQFATFWTPFFRLAIVPEFCSSVTFPEILGWPLANEMLVMGRKLTAREALSSGLVSTVVSADSESEFLEKVKLELRRNVLGSFAAAESVGIFKRIMWRERRPKLLRVFAEECAELDRRVRAGRPKAALKHLARPPPVGGSKL
ncbi:unnamed protein product [Scytosiphon promiscuus]